MTDDFADLTDRERQLVEVSVHEAAHAVVGTVLGGRVKLATVVGGLAPGSAPIIGNTVFADLPVGQDAAVAYAGPYAAAYWRAGHRRPSQAEVFAQLRGSGCEDDAILLASAATATAATKVTPLVVACWKPILRLAGKIAADAVVRHRDVTESLGLSSDGPTCALQLSHIRSGAAPGSFRVSRATA